MVAGISLFFQWFGVLAFIGSIVIFVMVRKLLKKEMPTVEEKQELLALGRINADTKKKSVLRSETQKLRFEKQIMAKAQEILQSQNDVKSE